MQPAPVPGSLNLEYLLLRGGEWVQSLHPGGWPHGVLVFVEDVYVLGMVLSLFFVVLIVYALIRLHQVEHEGFRRKEMQEHEERGQVVAPPVNDRWQNIMMLAYGPGESDWRRSILEADVMLFDLLREQGYSGETVGDQLKGANPIQITTLDLAWKAHKMRNDVAHEGENLKLTERDVKVTIDYYKRVFEELGVV